MPYEDDYKMWLEKMLIEMNPDWVCDGMADKEFTHDWCEEYCGKDNAYITPKCLHMFYHHIVRADRKTEPSDSEKPNDCDYAVNPSGDVWECSCYQTTLCEHQKEDFNPDGTINIVECKTEQTTSTPYCVDTSSVCKVDTPQTDDKDTNVLNKPQTDIVFYDEPNSGIKIDCGWKQPNPVSVIN